MITNYLSPVSFKVAIDRIPNVEFFTQRVAIPNVSMQGATQASPLYNLYNVPDRIEFAELDLSFIVDENMENYKEIFDWMKGLANPTDLTKRNLEDTKHGQVSDISVIVENSNRNGNIEFTFTDCFPLSLSPVQLDVTGTDIIYPECNVIFRYNLMDFKKIS